MDKKKIVVEITPEEIEFLRESNAIEGEFSSTSLQDAIFAWDYLKRQDELTPSIVLKTHKILTRNSVLPPNKRGHFRQEPVWIGGRKAKPFYVVPELIENWCTKMNNDKHINKSKALHVEYEGIHPFIDFNGRTGRIFLNWYRLQLKQPILIIKEQEKQKYYQWFHENKTK